MPVCWLIAFAVSKLSLVIIITLIPAVRHFATTAVTLVQSESAKPIKPTKLKDKSLINSGKDFIYSIFTLAF